MSSAALAFCATCALCLALVPLIKSACDRLGLTDRPDSHRKLHQRPVALGGGVAALLSTIAVSLPLLILRSDVAVSFRSSLHDLTGLLVAATFIVLLGVLDDAVGLRGRQKLLGQIAACSVLLLFGLVIERLQLFGFTVELGLLSIPVTLLWLLAAINAINLLDGTNGLAALIGIIDSLAISALSAINGHYAHALVAAAFAGSLLGFLRYNFPYAKIFLGDAGSMLIGLVIGGMAVQTSLKGPGTVLLATPLCLMVIPLFDSAAAMIRRKLTGRSIFSGDRAHLHHRLSERFGSTRAVAIVAVSCGVSAIAALASIVWRNELVAVISGVAIIVMFVISKMFGHTEVSLLASRIHSTVRSFFRLNGRQSGGDTHSTVHLQGNQEWELAWMRFRDAAMDLAVNKIELNVNAPMIQEGFHASWRRQAADLENGWRFEIPLLAAGRHRIGHIRVAGTRSLDVQAAGFEKILALIEFFESEIEALFLQAGEGESVGRPARAKLRLVAQSREIGAT